MELNVCIWDLARKENDDYKIESIISEVPNYIPDAEEYIKKHESIQKSEKFSNFFGIKALLFCGNIIESVARGIDFFDCVMPARNGRHGHLFTWKGIINIKNEKYARDLLPIDPECSCPVCRRYSRAYIRHLFKAEEMLAMRLAVAHNLYFYNDLMARIRDSLDQGCFAQFRQDFSEILDKRI